MSVALSLNYHASEDSNNNKNSRNKYAQDKSQANDTPDGASHDNIGGRRHKPYEQGGTTRGQPGHRTIQKGGDRGYRNLEAPRGAQPGHMMIITIQMGEDRSFHLYACSVALQIHRFYTTSFRILQIYVRKMWFLYYIFQNLTDL